MQGALEQLEARLAAAVAAPPDKDADVLAFIEGVALEREAAAALPLSERGGRAPPPSGPAAAAEQRKVRGLLPAAVLAACFPDRPLN